MSMEVPRRDFARLGFLDTLRGVAACYIVIFHLAYVPTTAMAIPAWLKPFVDTGQTAVILFFVISAFALCYSASERAAHSGAAFGEYGNGTLSAFYLRRFFRIAPLFYGMLAFYIVGVAVASARLPGPLQFLINASFTQNLFPEHIEGIVGASWTIGVEMLFYLVFPFLYIWARDIPRSLLLFALSAGLAWLWGEYLDNYAVARGYVELDQLEKVQQFSFLNHLPAFMLGMLAYRLFRLVQSSLDDRQQTRAAIAALVLFLAMFVGLLNGSFGYGWIQLLSKPLTYTFLLLGLGLFPMRAVVNRTTVALGKMSFSLYLIHPILLLLMTPVFRRIYDIVPQDFAAFMLSAVGTFTLLIGLSWVSYQLIEKPGIRIGEWWLARRQVADQREQAPLGTP